MTHIAAAMYHSAEHMDHFLQTLNYWSCYEALLPRWLTDAAKESGLNAGDRLRLLDVGCGSGELTSAVCQAMGQAFAVELSVLEPSASLLHRCVDRISATRPGVLVNASQGSFQDLGNATGSFDIVLCSHSLYQPLEETMGGEPPRSPADRVAHILLRTLAPRGVFCVILASQNSWAYECKKSAYQLLGLPIEAFSHAERLRAALVETGTGVTAKTVDTYADTTSFSCTSEEERKRSIRWLSFFLRVNCESLHQELQDQLIAIVRDKSIPFRCLPQHEREHCTLYPAVCGMPHENTLVLFHKELAMIGNKD